MTTPATLLSLGAITIKAYRVHVNDTTHGDSEIAGALNESQELLEDELRRKLALDEYTDTFRIGSDGRIYPNAYPITAATLTIDGRALRGAEPDGGPFIGVWEPLDNPRATITWTGGFTVGTFPKTLEHALYDLAKALLDEALVPVGVTSLSLGDASVTFGTGKGGGVDAYVTGLSARVRRFQNRLL